jgi:cardiolipin synthase
MHRKIVVIDGEIAFTGSLNLVDPRFFKQDSGFGQWVDAMVRLQGPAVEPLAITFLKDWELERYEGIESLRVTADVRRLPETGDSTVQVVPTGPTIEGDAIQILLMTIYAARRELIITTPYFVADEALLTAMISAARRGVEVTLIVPAHVDSLLVRFASRAHMGELLVAGVKVRLFDGGLLHTKSITVDGELCLFGSLNMDPRSLYLNFEITLAVYDHGFTSDLRALQQSYLAESSAMKLDDWTSRSRPQQFADNVARLLSPLL